MKSSGKKIFFLIALVAIAVAGGIAYNRSAASGVKPQEAGDDAGAAFVRVETVAANKTIRDSIVQNMSIEAVDRVQMTPRVSGRLEKFHVRQGDKVAAGQLIATLEHEQQDAQIGSAGAQLASAKADSEKARAEMMNAKTDLDRYKRLVKEGFSTQQQYDTMETKFVSARANYNASLAKERQVSSELGRVRASQQDYIVRSPMNGTVLNDYALTPGAMISPSSPIVDIADLRRLKATLRVPETKIFVVKPGMPVFLRFDALPAEEFKGAVTRIDQYVEPSTRTSAVEIELDNASAGNRLRPGMFGQASLVEREFTNAVLLPQSALHASDRGEYVFVEENGTAQLRNVDTGIRQGDDVQILNGVKPGEKVIVFGGANLKDGDKVAVQNGNGDGTSADNNSQPPKP